MLDWLPVAALLAFVAALPVSTLFPSRSTEPLAASYSLAYDPTKAFDGIPAYDVMDVFGAQRISGFVVIADDAPGDTGASKDGTIIRLEQLKKRMADLRQMYGDFLDPAPPLPFAMIQTAVIRRVEGGITQLNPSSEKIIIAPVAVLHRRDVPAWRLTMHAWNFTPDAAGYAPRFFRVLQAKPLEWVDGNLVPIRCQQSGDRRCADAR